MNPKEEAALAQRTSRAEAPVPAGPRIEPLPEGFLEDLEQASAHPHDASAREGVERIQTHISQLFLTPTRVYKFRKDVELPFVSFALRGERDADCLREVALNRRLAPDVYLGVAPLRRGPGASRSGRCARRSIRPHSSTAS